MRPEQIGPWLAYSFDHHAAYWVGIPVTVVILIVFVRVAVPAMIGAMLRRWRRRKHRNDENPWAGTSDFAAFNLCPGKKRWISW